MFLSEEVERAMNLMCGALRLQGRGHKVICNNFPGGQNDSNQSVNDSCLSADMLMNIKCIGGYCASSVKKNKKKHHNKWACVNLVKRTDKTQWDKTGISDERNSKE